MDVGRLRPLIRVGDAREVLQFPAERPRVEPLRVPPDKLVQGAIHEDLTERHTSPQSVSGRRIRGNGCDDHYVGPGLQARARGLSEPPDVLDAVSFREAEITAEITSYDVAVQQLDLVASLL